MQDADGAWAAIAFQDLSTGEVLGQKVWQNLVRMLATFPGILGSTVEDLGMRECVRHLQVWTKISRTEDNTTQSPMLMAGIGKTNLDTDD